MSLSPEAVEALRAAAATRADVARLVFVEGFGEAEGPAVVVVLDEPPSEPPPREFSRALLELFGPALPKEPGFGLVTPSAVGLPSAIRGGTTIYEREPAA